MDEDFAQKLQRDIEKSGFASEMFAIRTFFKRGWKAQPQAYQDLDHGVSREIDLVAHKNVNSIKDNRYSVEYSLVAEVKKSERPWIVFCHNASLDSSDLTSLSCFNIFTEDLPFEWIEFLRIMEESSLAKKIGWIGASIHESFKDPSVPTRWYPACTSLFKAIDSFGMRNSVHREDIVNHLKETRTSYLEVVRPLIILNGGPLIKATLDSYDQITLQEIEHAVLKFEYSSSKYEEKTVFIDITTLGGLESYLQIVEKRISRIADRFEEGLTARIENQPF